jgi:hypothetical protein
MKSSLRKLMSVLLVAMLAICFTVTPVLAMDGPEGSQRHSGGAMLLDALFLRPLGLVSLVGGTALFIVTLPFSIPGGNTEQAANRLIADPAEYTFGRPLGQLE